MNGNHSEAANAMLVQLRDEISELHDKVEAGSSNLTPETVVGTIQVEVAMAQLVLRRIQVELDEETADRTVAALSELVNTIDDLGAIMRSDRVVEQVTTDEDGEPTSWRVSVPILELSRHQKEFLSELKAADDREEAERVQAERSGAPLMIVHYDGSPAEEVQVEDETPKDDDTIDESLGDA